MIIQVTASVITKPITDDFVKGWLVAEKICFRDGYFDLTNSEVEHLLNLYIIIQQSLAAKYLIEEVVDYRGGAILTMLGHTVAKGIAENQL